MSPLALSLVTSPAISMVGALGGIVVRRTRVPELIWLMLGGIVPGLGEEAG